jgi:undecaprenyl-diphosphatase
MAHERADRVVEWTAVTTEDPTSAAPWGGFRHPGAAAAASVVALAASYLVAVQRPVPMWEQELTETINDLPDAVASMLYPIMQLGTLGGPVVAAGLVYAIRRDWLLSGAIVAAGVFTWFGAKGVKRVVDRGRPRAFLPEIVIREGDGSGLGFISGHSAVAAVSAVMVMGVLPVRWRWVPPLLAALVGIARVVHGVHLPADIIGGWAFGTLIGLGALGLVDVARTRQAST